MLAAKLIFAILLAAVFILGVLMFKNFDRVLGGDAAVPSENEGSRFLNKSQFVVVWALAMKLLIMMVCIV